MSRKYTQVSFTAKCADMFNMEVTDSNGETHEYDGYVPSDMGIGGGDYIRMTIDLETGKIAGFDVVDEDVEDALEE